MNNLWEELIIKTLDLADFEGKIKRKYPVKDSK